MEGADLQNILYLRDVKDADAVVDAVAQAKKGNNKVSQSPSYNDLRSDP